MFLKASLYFVAAIAIQLSIGIVFSATIPTSSHHDHAESHSAKRLHPKLNTNDPLIGSEQLKLEKTNKYWQDKAKAFVAAQSEKKLNKNVAKNIIFFMGDGMSMPTLAAVRSYLGGEEKSYSFETFPHVGMSKTYCVDLQVADSAVTATAYLNGVKANYGTIGVGPKVGYANCTEAQFKSEYTTSIAQWAMDAGKSAGLVTTTRVTHASPAGCYVNTADRFWENDSEMRKRGCDPDIVDDIAKQLVYGETGSKLQVILGGGRREFRSKEFKDEVKGHGLRSDGRNMIDEWVNQNKNTENRTYVWNTTSLNSVDANTTTHLLGLFDSSHMKYRQDVVDGKLEDQQPSLTEMVTKAIEVLSKNENGYFLFVEGGLIDKAMHFTEGRLALDETAEFSKAVDYARRAVNSSDTILLVTADHAHTMTYSGYSVRGDKVTGLSDIGANDNMTYYKINFANGPSYFNHVKSTGGRVDPKTLQHDDSHFVNPSTVPAGIETHGGDDVAVYVSGPWSHLFTGTYEQNAIPHMLAYAACIGNGQKVCDKK